MKITRQHATRRARRHGRRWRTASTPPGAHVATAIEDAMAVAGVLVLLGGAAFACWAHFT